MDLKDIFNSWLSSFNPTDIQRNMSKERIAICAECPSLNRRLNINQDWAAYCGECGCPINKKVFSMVHNSCPLAKWGEVDEKYLPRKKNTTLI